MKNSLTQKTWTPERRAQLKSLWGIFSVRSISWIMFGDEFHQYAIIGKAHRMGLRKLQAKAPHVNIVTKPCRYCTFPAVGQGYLCQGCLNLSIINRETLHGIPVT